MFSGRQNDPIPVSNLFELFAQCNERYFDGELEPTEGFVLRFTRSVKLSGCFRYCLDTSTDWAIEISGRLRDHPRALRSTMVHEMIHMLAHQRYRLTGDRSYLDEQAIPGKPFVNPSHGAFFLGEVDRLNRRWPELGISVKSTFGDHLYEPDRIAPRHLLVVTIESGSDKGMIYSLHPRATIDLERLRQTAEELHEVRAFTVLRVSGELAEGFPVLRRDNAPRKRMRRLSLRGFSQKVRDLRRHPRTLDLLASDVTHRHAA
ncbi:MAG: SprT-like domain-containing protein [Marinobacter sp.]